MVIYNCGFSKNMTWEFLAPESMRHFSCYEIKILFTKLIPDKSLKGTIVSWTLPSLN